MKKIIAAFNGLRFSKGTLDFTLFLCRHTHSFLVAAFLDDYRYRQSRVAYPAGLGEGDDRLLFLPEEEAENRRQTVELVKHACEQAEIGFGIHHDRNIAFRELVTETVFADLLVINRSETFTPHQEEAPSGFLQALTDEAHCPVLAVPDHFEVPEKTVLLHDGEPASVYSFKMFSYLLPSLKSERVEVLGVKSEQEGPDRPDSAWLKEWIHKHFPTADWVCLQGDPVERIPAYLQQQSEPLLLVMGASRKSQLVRLFQPDLSSLLMAKLRSPVFITHH